MKYGDVTQHKAMASGGDMASGDFGCKPLDHCKGPSMASEAMMKGGAMGEGGRGAAPPVRHSRHRMKAQAQSQHGSHE